MAAQSGKDMLLKLDSTGSGSFLTVAGLRTRSLAFNAAAIDITDAESAGEKFDAGATLVQLYSGMVYRGPFFAAEIARALADRQRK